MFTSIPLPTEAVTAGTRTDVQPRQPNPTAADAVPGINGFCWPAPLSALYGKAQPWTQPQACDLEGINGAMGHCALVSISPADQTVQIQIERTKLPVTLAFSQFRRLTLKQPIYPQDLLSSEHFPDIQSRQASAEYHLQLADGSVRSGLTVGYLETPFGLFVFTPLDNRGAVERVFIPRGAFVSVSLSDPVGVLTSDATTADVMTHSAPAVSRTLKLDDYLADAKVVSREQLMLALDHQSKMPAVRVGEALLRLGFVSEVQLQQALAEQSGRSAKPLGELLIQAGVLTRRDLNTALARKMGYPVVDVTRFPIEAAALEKIPLSTARRLMVLPLLARGELTVVASPDPTHREFFEELEFLLHGRVIATLGDEDQIRQTLTTAYARLSQSKEPDSTSQDESASRSSHSAESLNLLERMDLLDLSSLTPDPPQADEKQAKVATESLDVERRTPALAEPDGAIAHLVNTMIMAAHSSGATAIHVEVPSDGTDVRLRFRQNGRLLPYQTLAHPQHAAWVAHLKRLAHLDAWLHHKAQVGRIDVHNLAPGQQAQWRIHTLPTTEGLEDVVLKLLPSASASGPLTLDQLDLSPEQLDHWQQAIQQPRGLVLCAGPAGSGKATTLRAVLTFLSGSERTLWRVQAQPDSAQPEVRQVQVNPHRGWTYAAALRALLQADADVLMADELTDTETARVALEAALTGHVMLSAVPAESAAGAVRQVLEMGVNPFSLGDALQAVLAQRLVDRFCPSCRGSEPASAAVTDDLLDDYLHAFPDAQRPARQDLLAQWLAQYGQQGVLHTYHATGCAACQGSGMLGRVGVHELLRPTLGLRRLIQSGASAPDIVTEAFKDGQFRTLRQDGIAKVLAGLTSIDDIRAHTHD